MKLRTWIDKLLDRLHPWIMDRRRPPSRRSRPRPRLSLEILEDRRVPSTYTVTNTSDRGPGSLRDAISSGDTNITFASYLAGHTITLLTGQLDINQSVTITGLGANQLAVSGYNSSRIFDIVSGATVQISGLTLENGSAVGGDPSVSKGVETLDGGGAILNDGTLTLTDCTISGNTAEGAIGGTSAQGGGYGGAIANAGTLTITGSTLEGNVARGGTGQAGGRSISSDFKFAAGGGGGGFGGAIINLPTGSLQLIDSTISGNDASGGAGGSVSKYAPITQDAGGQGGDSAAGFGNGGVDYSDSPGGQMGAPFGGGGGGAYTQNVVFEIRYGAGGNGGFGGGGGGGAAYNSSVKTSGGASGAYAGAGGTPGFLGGGGGGAGLGGGVFNDGGSITLTASTIANNTAAGGIGGAGDSSGTNNSGSNGQGVGGGLFNNGSGAVNVLSSIIAQNNLTNGNQDTDVFGSVTDKGNNFVGTTSGSSGFGSATLSGDPLLEPLGNNGGPTPTLALAYQSVCIGTGSTSIVGQPYNLTTDQRGLSREDGGSVDIGAYQYQTLSAPMVTAVNLQPQVQEGTFSGPVESFTGNSLSAADYTATINWGDGTISPGTITSEGGNLFMVSGMHTFTSTGDLTATVTVTDNGTPNASGVWNTITPLPTGAFDLTAATGINGIVYVFGGWNGASVLDTVQGYNPATGAWTSEANMPIAAAGAVAVADPNGLIYVIGGYTGTEYLSGVQIYNPVTNQWTTGADSTASRDNAAAALGSDGQIYVIGGFNGTNSTSANFAYNPATNAWTSYRKLPTAVQGAAAVAGPNDLIYIFGGQTGSSTFSTVQVFNPQSGVVGNWTTAASMPFASAFLAAAPGIDGQFYVFGGNDNNGDVLSSVAAFNPATNTWTNEASLPAGRSNLAAAAGPDGELYVMGGLDLDNNDSAEVDTYYPGVSYTTSLSLNVANPSVTATAFSVVLNSPYSGQVATFTDSANNNNLPASDYAATIHWGDVAGDSTDTLGDITQPGGPGTPYVVMATTTPHTYTADGPYTFTVSIAYTGFSNVTSLGSATASVDEAPSLTSGSSALFPLGMFASFTVTTGTAYPTPNITESGALPTGVGLTDNGNGTATLSGTPSAGKVGNYVLTITASNGISSDATQTFTLTVGEPPYIDTSSSTTFTAGTFGSFTVRGNDFPSASFTEFGALPSGVSFTDNGNSSATLSGTPAAGTTGTYTFTITASNGVSPDATQVFTLTVDGPPTITSGNSALFPVGASDSFTVTTSPGIPAYTVLSYSGTLPAVVSFVDHVGGTATIGGTPSAGTEGTYVLTITASNGVSPDATQTFTLTVGEAPEITSSNNTTLVMGTYGSFTVTSGNDFPAPSFTESGALPSGVSFTDNGNGTATLSGTPNSGTAGNYIFTITASNGVSPDATQTFTLTVGEAPDITSSTATVFTVGAPGSFTVTSGNDFPAPSFTEFGVLPSGVSFTDNGNGTATLSGTPRAGTAGAYTLTITASNGISPDATQTFTLQVDQASLTTLGSFTDANSTVPLAGLVEDAKGDLFGTTEYGGGSSDDGTVFEVLAGSSRAITLATFNGGNGANPYGMLILDSSGNLFGTTGYGGAYGDGTVFEVKAGSDTITTLASFNGTDGANPYAGLVEDASGDLFGTTAYGGASNQGAVFEVKAGSGTITMLASLNGANGANPFGNLTLDSDGNLFGTTVSGGLSGDGTVFEVQAGSGTITTLASFSSFGYGADPFAGLVEDSSGNLFGTTDNGGGNDDGTVFEVAVGSGIITTLAAFDGTNGEFPYAGLVIDRSGNLFGTTSSGGAFGNGTVFEMSKGNYGAVTTLVFFDSLNGSQPDGSLFEDKSGNLFGTTYSGGMFGDGTVFEVRAGSGTITTLVSFYASNGAAPEGGLVEDKSGDLFGTSSEGGADGDGDVFEISAGSGVISPMASFNGPNGSEPVGSLVMDTSGDLFGTTELGGIYGEGTVFEVPAGSSTIVPLFSFGGESGGLYPAGGLVLDASGDLFGTTAEGGAYGDGTVFELMKSNYGDFTTLASFDGNNGAGPLGGLVEDSNGNFFGVTFSGGTSNDGTVFEVQARSGTITTLASFNGTDGANPYAGLVEDESGDLFGTTAYGGVYGDGTVFELMKSNSGSLTTLATFNSANGAKPEAGLFEDGHGDLFGTTNEGGTANDSTVFELANVMPDPPASPTLTANPEAAAEVGTDIPLTFSVKLGGGYNETGSITFKLYNPGDALVDTETVTVGGNGTYSTPDGYLPVVSGTYLWGANFSGDGNNNSASTSSVIAVDPALSITASLPQGTAGRRYDQTITVSGGTAHYTTLKVQGFNGGSTGVTASAITADPCLGIVVVQGTPANAGTITFMVTVTDIAGSTLTKSYSITINAAPRITSLTATQWTVGRPGFTGKMAITGGTGPFTVAAFSGLPTGLTPVINGTTISFTGTPTTTGTFRGTITIQDANGARAVVTFNITINRVGSFVTTTLPAAVAGIKYSAALQTERGTGPLTFALGSGRLPAGLRLGSNGEISGIPLSSDTNTGVFTVIATDAAGATFSASFTLAVLLIKGRLR